MLGACRGGRGRASPSATPGSPRGAQRPVVLAGVGIADGEVVHAPERVGVVGPELRLLQRQRLLEELDRPVVLAGGGIADWRGCSCYERVGVVGPELRLLQRQRLLAELQRRSFWPASA